MKLTNIERDAFVRAVMDDVPAIDYNDQARLAVQKWAIDRLPPKVKAIAKEFGHLLNRENHWQLPHPLHGVMIVTGNIGESMAATKSDADLWPKIEAFASAARKQNDERDRLKQSVRGAIYACTTVKQAQDRLPEFAKYLRKGIPAASREVPVIANLVSDLVAAGWPKSKTRARESAAA